MTSRDVSNRSLPLSLDEVTEEAKNFDFVTERPLQSWLRTGRTLLTQAAISEHQDDLQTAFLLTYRHAILILDKIPRYSDAEKARCATELSKARKRVRHNLLKLETWKPLIQQAYLEALESLKVDKAELARHEHLQQAARKGVLTSAGINSSPDRNRRSIDAAEHRDLAIRLASDELQRRGHATAPNLESSKGVWQSTDDATNVSKLVQETGKLLHRRSQVPDVTRIESPVHYNYPSVLAKEADLNWISASSTNRNLPPSATDSNLSKLPPAHSAAPPIPVKQPSAPARVRFKIKAWTEGGDDLRSVFLPSKLQQRFLNHVHPNTSRNLETCGVLCASLVSNALIITHLVITEQTSTSDLCDTTEDGDLALLDFCEEHQLLVCGWIHTHPSQTCFLSSRDLHTSSGYQQMLAEAIAIVCAPKHSPSIGIFRLTNPPGLPAVLRCSKPGLFHPHAEQNLYTDATAPGHVIQDENLEFKLIDLRPA